MIGGMNCNERTYGQDDEDNNNANNEWHQLATKNTPKHQIQQLQQAEIMILSQKIETGIKGLYMVMTSITISMENNSTSDDAVASL